MSKKGSGWYRESHRHSLSAKGIKTSPRKMMARGREFDVKGNLVLCGMDTGFALEQYIKEIDDLYDTGNRTAKDVLVENIEAIENLCNNDEAVLYRILWHNEEIDLDNLGLYYTYDIENFSKGREYPFINNLWDYNENVEQVWKNGVQNIQNASIVKVKVDTNNIDLLETSNELTFPYDRTIVLWNQPKEVLDIIDLRGSIIERKDRSYKIDWDILKERGVI